MEVVQDNANITGQEAEAEAVNACRLGKGNDFITVDRIFRIGAIIIVVPSGNIHFRLLHRQGPGLAEDGEGILRLTTWPDGTQELFQDRAFTFS
jgi:hypothetical protein